MIRLSHDQNSRCSKLSITSFLHNVINTFENISNLILLKSEMFSNEQFTADQSITSSPGCQCSQHSEDHFKSHTFEIRNVLNTFENISKLILLKSEFVFAMVMFTADQSITSFPGCQCPHRTARLPPFLN